VSLLTISQTIPCELAKRALAEVLFAAAHFTTVQIFFFLSTSAATPVALAAFFPLSLILSPSNDAK
jgi:hypothetical protein